MDSQGSLWSLVHGLDILHISEDMLSLDETPECDVVLVHPGSGTECDVELGPVRVGAWSGRWWSEELSIILGEIENS